MVGFFYLYAMKAILILLLVGIGFNSMSQSDTTEIYVINNTNRLVQITQGEAVKYSFFYRDLKFVKTIRELEFDNKEEVEKFFEQAIKVLDTDTGVMGAKYNLSRNQMSKNTLKLRNKEDGYTMINRDTLENMMDAFNRNISN